jgi:predicted SPOUT superfamily RNA methylase MTH1
VDSSVFYNLEETQQQKNMRTEEARFSSLESDILNSVCKDANQVKFIQDLLYIQKTSFFFRKETRLNRDVIDRIEREVAKLATSNDN